MAVRTLHFTNAWHASSGGVRTVYEALLTQAARDRRHMTVVVPGEQSAVLDYGPTAKLRVLRAPSSPFFDRRYRLLLPNRYLHIGHGPIWSIIERERPDVIEVSDKFALVYLAGLIKRRSGPRPTIVGFTQERLDDALTAFITKGPAGRAWARWYLARIYLRQFDAHLANSTYTAKELIDAIDHYGPTHWKLWRLRDRVWSQPLGVDLGTFDPGRRSSTRRQMLLERAGGTSGSILVAFAGRLAREKHTDWLIPALADLVRRGHDARLVVAGAGPLLGEIARASARLVPGRVLFVGHVADRHDLAELVASADIFLHPNPREPFGIGPLEAMACGTPVVVPNSGGVLSYANGGNAWLADSSPSGLADALEAALAAPASAEQRATKALSTARALGWPEAASRLLDTYETIHRARLRNYAVEGNSTAGSDRPSRVSAPFRSSR